MQLQRSAKKEILQEKKHNFRGLLFGEPLTLRLWCSGTYVEGYCWGSTGTVRRDILAPYSMVDRVLLLRHRMQHLLTTARGPARPGRYQRTPAPLKDYGTAVEAEGYEGGEWTACDEPSPPASHHCTALCYKYTSEDCGCSMSDYDIRRTSTLVTGRRKNRPYNRGRSLPN